MNKANTIYILLFLFIVLFAMPLKAQESDYDKIFNDFKAKQEVEFNDFKNKVDEEFALFLKETWKHFEVEEPASAPVRPEPKEPVVFDEKKPVAAPVQIKPKLPDLTDKPIIPGVSSFIPVQINKPILPIGKPISRKPISFYGTIIPIATSCIEGFSLTGINESDVVDAWTKVCQSDYEQLLYDCVEARTKYKLNDWGYLLLTKQIALQLYGSDKMEEVAFIQMFLLIKSGYKARLSKVNEKLMLLIATTDTLYGKPKITIEGVRYYIFEPISQKGPVGLYTYQQDFADAKNLIRLTMQEVPLLDMEEHSHEIILSETSFSVTSVINRNLIEFYRDYPQGNVSMYYKTPISEELKGTLYPALNIAISGKSQYEAVSFLLTFIQKGFEYMTDNEQFGYEKPYFIEENFFYPYNDCEDRAMLFAILVKDLLKLDVVLLDYPNHIASAVCFNEEIEGDCIIIDEKKYVICDPTYIDAPIGLCMDEFKQVEPDIIR